MTMNSRSQGVLDGFYIDKFEVTNGDLQNSWRRFRVSALGLQIKTRPLSSGSAGALGELDGCDGYCLWRANGYPPKRSGKGGAVRWRIYPWEMIRRLQPMRCLAEEGEPRRCRRLESRQGKSRMGCMIWRGICMNG